MAEWFDGYVKSNGITVHYYRTGGSSGNNKPQLILLHGILDDGLCWTPVVRDLQDQYDIIMLDARGHGHSDPPTEHFPIETLADDVAGVIRELGLEKPYIFGHSMGAETATALAANYPDLLRAIILEDPPFIDRPLQVNPL